MDIPAYRSSPAPDPELPVWVSTYTGSDAVPPHQHVFVEVANLTRGRCRHLHLGTERTLGPGDAFVVLPDETHAYHIPAEVEIRNCKFLPEALGGDWPTLSRLGGLFYLLMVEPVFRGESTAPQVLHLDPEAREDAVAILEKLRQEQTRSWPDTPLLLKAYLVEYLVFLSRACSRQPVPHSEAVVRVHRQDMVRGALEYIEEHYTEDLRVGDLAAQVHLSPDHLRRVFRRLTGLSPLEYINQLRIRRATELLATTVLSVTEVGMEVGIADPSYFTRLFRQHVGQSPSAYRRTSVLCKPNPDSS